MKRLTDAEHRKAAERQAAEILGAVDFSAPRGVSEVLATYTLTLHGPPMMDGATPLSSPIPRGWLRETEENLTDLLPAGYRVEIKEWDE